MEYLAKFAPRVTLDQGRPMTIVKCSLRYMLALSVAAMSQPLLAQSSVSADAHAIRAAQGHPGAGADRRHGARISAQDKRCHRE
jgi:hypothetical protein